MVRLEKVNKYFNKRKQNEIHVIKNTSLEMESTGLVALLGPSGCGKTTLLNVIGGLDKVGKGKIFINGKQITGKSAGRIDKIRNLNIDWDAIIGLVERGVIGKLVEIDSGDGDHVVIVVE